MTVEQFGYKEELKRSLSFQDIIIFGLALMVPVSPFVVGGYMMETTHGMAVMVFAAGALAMFVTVLSYACMIETFPIAGSVYSYAQRGINQSVGFVAGWAIILDYLFIPALLYLVSATAFSTWLPINPMVIVLIFLIVNTLANTRGVEITATINKGIVVFDLVVLGIFLAFGVVFLLKGSSGTYFSMAPLYNPDYFTWKMVFGSVPLAVLAFVGFDGVSTYAEEVKGGTKTLGRALLLCLFIISTLFIVQTWVGADLAKTLPISSADTAFYDVAGMIAGPWLTVLTSLAIALSWGFAASIAYQGSISRILFSMARDGKIPPALRKVHPKYQTPYVGIALAAIVVLITSIGFRNHIELLTNLVSFGALVAFLVLHVAVINHFIIREKSKQYFKHLISPVLGIVIISYVLYSVENITKIIGFSWIAIGILISLVQYYRSKRTIDQPSEKEVA